VFIWVPAQVQLCKAKTLYQMGALGGAHEELMEVNCGLDSVDMGIASYYVGGF
jgi:hypothetical protein